MIGEVTLNDFQGSILKINHAAWLSEKYNKVDFGVTDKRDLIIAGIDGERQTICAVRRKFDSVHPNGYTSLEHLVGDLFAVRIRLICEADGSLLDDYDMILEVAREPELAYKLTSEFFWKRFQLSNLELEAYDFLRRLSDIGHETHEKRMALPLGDDIRYAESLMTIRAAEKEAERPIAESAKEWEALATIFIGRHASEAEKKQFFDTRPTVDQGFERERKPALLVALAKESQDRNYTLYDSIRVRLDILNTISKNLKR